MKKMSFLLVLFTITTISVFAQEKKEEAAEKKGFKKENLFIGGNFGASFGNYTQIIFSPQVGYRFNPVFAAGAGVNVQYVAIKSYDYQGNDYSKQSQGVYGLNLFARAYPIRQAFLQVQPEFNFIKGKLKYYNSNIPDQKFNANAPSLLVGAGIGLGGGYISLMYDVLQNSNSPYSNKPFINFGFGF
ncbi:MAG: hypothetical protein ABIX01_19205 [Chitinophagaceae bacterium]